MASTSTPPSDSSPPSVEEQEEGESNGIDPFVIDDEDDTDTEPPSATSESSRKSPASQISADDVPLSAAAQMSSFPPHSASSQFTTFAANRNKDVPSPPSDSEQDDEDIPELYLPSLVTPTMFLPIPNTDPLTTLLTKYISAPEKRPVRDTSGNWQHSNFHSLVMSNSWRALATMARDRLLTTDPEDLTLVLGLWYLRVSSLARLRLFNQASAECNNLFSVLNNVEPEASRTWLFDRLLPFELEVMQARLKYWAGDNMSYLDSLSSLLKKCKAKARATASDSTSSAMWKERGARVTLIIASQLVEMKDFKTASKLMEPLCYQSSQPDPQLQSAIARIYLQGGYIQKATAHFESVKAHPDASEEIKSMNEALLASANGDWKTAEDRLRREMSEDTSSYVAANNLAVALLNQGKLKEAIGILVKALAESPSTVVVAEPYLFNLSTLYELRSATAAGRKRDLLIEVARSSGDGLKTTCLKMPSN